MTVHLSEHNATSTKRTALAVATLFFVNGAVFSNWLPRIPEVRDRLGVDNRGLGASLIGGGLGGLVGSFVVAYVLARLGSKLAVTIAATSLALLLPLIAVVPSPFALAAVLTAMGFSDVINDMAMNTQGVIVQGRLAGSIMHRLHGAWSLGFVMGAGIGWLASAAEISVGAHLSAVSVVLLIGLYSVRSLLISNDPPPPPPLDAGVGLRSDRRRLYSPVVIAMAVTAVGVAFVEASPNDWSAVALRDLFDAGRLTGLGPVVFAGAMLMGRLVGDHVLARIGPERLVEGALAIAALGAAIVITAPVLAISLVGFAVWGLGVSVMFPQLYSMAATLPGTATGAGLGAMAIGQRLGFMIAPLAIGAIAELRDLRWAFAVIVVAAVAIVSATRRTIRGPAMSPTAALG